MIAAMDASMEQVDAMSRPPRPSPHAEFMKKKSKENY
jgi:hypothetical protein